jgi:two-component system chemotaxis sensor kinase CheA
MLDDEEFLRELMETFREDSQERIKLLAQAVVDLEAAPNEEATRAALETLFRETHSLKGAAGAVDYSLVVSICQDMESVFAALKGGDLQPAPAVIDALSESVDCLHECVLTKKTGLGVRAAGVLTTLQTLMAPARAQASGRPSQACTPSPEERVIQAVDMAAATTDTVRVPTARLEDLLLQAEELISLKLSAGERASTLLELSSRLQAWKREWYKARVGGSHDTIEQFLEWNSSFMESLAADIRLLARSSDDERRTLGPMVDELVDGMKRVLMLPVSSLLSSFPKMVRDLARSRNKQVELAISGAAVEVDKRVIENLKDPLIHLLRNSVDHGIETAEERQRQGKSLRGQIRIDVSQLENNKIQICVSDDGKGIDVQRLRATAVRDGLRTQAEIDELSDAEALRLIFASGFSTSAVVSRVSGRGLGLAIVEEKVECLGGSVTIETEIDKGTTFRIVVPATVATTRGILVEVSDWACVLPILNVDRVARVRKQDLCTVEGCQTVQLEGRTLPIVSLREALALPVKPQRNATDYLQVVVAHGGEHRIAFAVDRVVCEREVLVKSLGPQLVSVPNIAGATILGSGSVVPIISVGELVQACVGRAPQAGRIEEAARSGADGPKAVLIAEDSITSRMLLKSVLEAAGYYVRPTVDGVDALKALQEEDFDLVISDVEMPRMDGFELTSRIRADARLARLPVVLVTALESDEHRERGLDAGASAYVAKSSFKEGTLLETARSLL